MKASQNEQSVRDQVRDLNKEIHHGLDLIHKGIYEKCLFESYCTEPTILAHSVSRAVLQTIQQDGEVLTPTSRTSKDSHGLSHINLTFRPEVITRASTGTFTCRSHDGLFNSIDSSPFDVNNDLVLNLLYYRAILKETWILHKIHSGMRYIEDKKGPLPTPVSIHPDTRLKALRDSIKIVGPFLHKEEVPLVHVVRHVKTPRPILAASIAGGGMTYLNEIEMPVSWTVSVLPQANEHVIVASFLKGSVGEKYFDLIRETNGRELQAAISAELIFFGENWFIHPKVWSAYGKRKRVAITEAYNNIEELRIGKYRWRDRDSETPWYKYLGVTNRHQLNLFRYDESAFSR